MSLLDKVKEGVEELLKISKDISESDIYEITGLIGTTGKVIKFAVSIPDRIFSRHLYIFMKAAREGDINKYEKFQQKMTRDLQYATKVTEAVIEQINRCDSESKAEYIGKIFSTGVVVNNMDTNQFIRLAQIVNSLYIDEIEYIVNLKDDEIDETSDIVEHLIATAVLTRSHGKIGFGNTIMPQRQPILTYAGKQLVALLSQ